MNTKMCLFIHVYIYMYVYIYIYIYIYLSLDCFALLHFVPGHAQTGSRSDPAPDAWNSSVDVQTPDAARQSKRARKTYVCEGAGVRVWESVWEGVCARVWEGVCERVWEGMRERVWEGVCE